MNELKPCPFCGGDAVFKKEEDKAVIFCSEEYCLAFMCVKFDFIDGFDNSGDCIRHLKENWNRRVPEWIPVEESPPDVEYPKRSKNYFCAYDDGTVRITSCSSPGCCGEGFR